MIETQAGELKKKKLKMNIITADDLLLSLDINLILSLPLPPSQSERTFHLICWNEFSSFYLELSEATSSKVS